ncbi:vWA domain-containing protein [Massilia sp. W12]|uniref:vWA domain-containing protein n=1 Tax=Massilia sp. W12 TaxID=3126507 RepID=UPI0030CE15E9
MRHTLLTLSLLSMFACSGAALAQDEAKHISAPQTERKIELVFVLDTTGSMGGLLEGAKSKIWGIVNDIMQKRGGKAQVKVGLVAYRDREDAYVTKVTPLSANLDEVYAQLMSFKAEGGGDMPEDVRSAMHDALQKTGWSKKAADTSQILFLVGDAPPHDDYRNVPDTIASAKEARRLGMIVNTIQCGNIRETTRPWREIAQYGGGEYFAIAQDGGVQSIATPYDAELAKYGAQMGDTYYAYGGAAMERSEKRAKQAKMESSLAAAAPKAAMAERAVNKALNSSAYEESDLLQQLESGKLSMDKLQESDLPEELRKLSAAERKAKLEKMLAERKELKQKILELNKQREQFLAKAQREQDKKAGKAGFDQAVSDALGKQIK